MVVNLGENVILSKKYFYFFFEKRILLQRLCPNDGAQLTFLKVQITFKSSGCTKHSTTSLYPYTLNIFPKFV